MREMVYLIGWHAVPADGGFDFVDRDHKRALSPVNSMYAIIFAGNLNVCIHVSMAIMVLLTTVFGWKVR